MTGALSPGRRDPLSSRQISAASWPTRRILGGCLLCVSPAAAGSVFTGRDSFPTAGHGQARSRWADRRSHEARKHAPVRIGTSSRKLEGRRAGRRSEALARVPPAARTTTRLGQVATLVPPAYVCDPDAMASPLLRRAPLRGQVLALVVDDGQDGRPGDHR